MTRITIGKVDGFRFLLFYLSLLFAGGDKTPVLWRLSFFGVWARWWVGVEDDPSDEETVCSAIASFHTSPPPCLFLGSTMKKKSEFPSEFFEDEIFLIKMAKLSLSLSHRNSPRYLRDTIWSEFQTYACITDMSSMAPPEFGRWVNPISTKGGRLCQPNNTGTPGFSDLPTALHQSLRANCSRQNARSNTRIKPFNDFFPSCHFPNNPYLEY